MLRNIDPNSTTLDFPWLDGSNTETINFPWLTSSGGSGNQSVTADPVAGAWSISTGPADFIAANKPAIYVLAAALVTLAALKFFQRR